MEVGLCHDDPWILLARFGGHEIHPPTGDKHLSDYWGPSCYAMPFLTDDAAVSLLETLEHQMQASRIVGACCEVEDQEAASAGDSIRQSHTAVLVARRSHAGVDVEDTDLVFIGC